MRLRWLERPADYMPVWRAMEAFTEARRPETPDELWLVEHTPVYTLGQAGLEEHILNPHGIAVVRCNRGGQVTYHGPGQVLLYTLMDLRRGHVFVKTFVRLLEQAVLETLADYGIPEACRKPGAPGIYVPQTALTTPHGGSLAKIAALGVKIRNGRAYHGVALNVAMDLAPFQGINPCGYAGLQTVDMWSCGRRANVEQVGECLAHHFKAAWQAAAHQETDHDAAIPGNPAAAGLE